MPRYASNRRTDAPANEIVHVRLTTREMDLLRAEAGARGLRPAELLREWIKQRPPESLVDALEALAERGDREEIEAADEILGEARRRLAPREPEVMMRRAG